MSEPDHAARSAGERMLSTLLQGAHVAHPLGLPGLVAEAVAHIGARESAVHLADHQQRLLIPVPVMDGPVAGVDPLPIDNSVAGRAFRSDEVVLGETDDAGGDGVRVWIPMLDGADRVGVLGLTLDAPDELAVARCRDFASLLAEVLVARDRYSDELGLVRRTREMSFAAEVRWSQLPPLTYVDDDVALSGVVEPAYEIAGDAFDYAVNATSTHLAIFDAMGHGLEASRLATLAVYAYRHGRRRHDSLHALYTGIDEVIDRSFGPDRFVTAQLAQLDQRTGRLEWMSAGHPRPLLLRNNRLVGELSCEPGLPLGLGGDPSDTGEIGLHPGDRVLFYSDGVTEARSPEGEEFGIDRLGDFLGRAAASGEPLAEMTRRLVHALLDHQHDRLQDDATLIILEWRPFGSATRPRVSGG